MEQQAPERVVPISEYRGGPPRQMGGAGVNYRLVKMRVDGLGKPPEEVTFDDLWELDGNNQYVPKDPERVVSDVSTNNKFLKRGLSWLTNTFLRNKSAVTEAERHLSDIDAGTRQKNPLRALVLVSDDSPLVHPGDARVEWNESDSTANAKIASSNSGAYTPAGYGIRGTLLNNTSGTLKVVQSRYPDTTYYTELEYTVFAQANASADETGADGIDNFPIKSLGIAYGTNAGFDDANSQWASRAVVGLLPTIQGWKWPQRVGIPASGDKGTDRVYVHENYIYDDAGSGSVSSLYEYTGADEIPGNGDGYVASYEAADGSLDNDVNLPITLDAAILLVNDIKTQYSAHIPSTTYHSVADSTNTVSSPDASNLASAITLANELKGDYNAHRTQAGVHPTDDTTNIVTAANATDLPTLTTLVNDIRTQYEAHRANATYHVAADSTNVVTAAAVGTADQFYATGRRIKLSNAAFTVAHANDRCVLVITGTTSNNGSFTIKRRIAANEVEVFETVVNEGPGPVGSATLVSRHTGDKVFDGRVENEGKVYLSADDGDPNAAVIMGQNWRSQDTPSGHFIGRIWNTARQIAGIRIICGKGTPREHSPDRWKVQYLDVDHGGSGNPQPADPNDWIDVPGQDYTGSGGKAVTVYQAGKWGVEYHFAALTPSTQGIKIRDLQNEAQDGYVEIQQIMAYEESDDHSIASPNNVLKIAVDGVPNFKTITIGDVSATKDMQDIVDALNEQFLGEELEAVRSEFGFLQIRTTVAGDNATIELDTAANGSTANASLGLDPTSGVAEKTGESQPITKQYDEALTLIVTASYIVDLPWAT
jgi:hypothetical protein